MQREIRTNGMRIWGVVALCLLSTVLTVRAAVYSYRGILLDGNGQPLNGARTLVMSLYAAEQGGTPLWQRKITISLDQRGQFVTELSEAVGSAVPGGPSARIGDVVTGNASHPLFLEVTVKGDPDTVLPRSRIGVVPRANCAETALSAPSNFNVKGKFEATGTVTCQKAARIAKDVIAHGNVSVMGKVSVGTDLCVLSGGPVSVSQSLTVTNEVRTERAKFETELDVKANASAMRLNVTTTQFTVNGANAYIQPGTIVMWPFDGPVPDGWVECDGQKYTNSDGTTGYAPDLTGRFIVGADGDAVGGAETSYRLGNTGGARAVALTIDAMPAHTHDYSFKRNDQCMRGAWSWSLAPADRKDGLSLSPKATVSAEFVTKTQHARSTAAAHNNLPPYWAVRYIMKKG